MNSSSNNPATEMFDRLQRKTTLPLVLVISAVALIVNGASVWMFPVIFVIVLLFVLSIVWGTRILRGIGSKFGGGDSGNSSGRD